MPVIPIRYALAGCFAWGAAYAAFLTWTKAGRGLALRWTELSVVIGVAGVLAFFATVKRRAAGIAFLFFAAGGAPMVFRSMWLRQEYDKSAMDFMRDELTRRAHDSGAE